MIEIVEHDPRWAQRFTEQREWLTQILAEKALRIEHVGSTSVPGLAAKPIIDVLVCVAEVTDPAAQALMESSGYELGVDEPGHRMYRTPARDVHVHFWAANDPQIERHLRFRDWLRDNAEDREIYEHVKRVLAQRKWRRSNDYAEAKTPVITAILRRANGQARGPRIDDFAKLILERLPARADVLEIGAGEGELAVRLAGAGHHVVALDKALRSRFPIVESSFEEYEPGGTHFDCIAAQLVLHHADDLDVMLDKIVALLAPGGFVAIDDYGWERSEDEAFRNDRSDLHRSDAMLGALRARFSEDYYRDHAYFDEGAGEDRVGFTFIGSVRETR